MSTIIENQASFAAPATSAPTPAVAAPQQPLTGLPTDLEKDLVQVFKLLADETRLRILTYLFREGELHVSALCERLQQSQPAVSHHLALLRVSGVIEVRRDGKHNFYSIKTSRLQYLFEDLFNVIAKDANGAVNFSGLKITRG